MIDYKKLPLQFVEDILIGLEESKSGKLSEYQFGKTKTVIDNVLKVKKHKISDELLNSIKIDARK